MPNQLVDIYLANIDVLTGWSSYLHRKEAIAPPHPQPRPGVDLVVPTISLGHSWSGVIDIIVGSLERGQQIDKFYMCGHGSSGEFTIGQKLTWQDDSTIAEFQRLRPFTADWRTNVYIIGCEVAADGPCVPMQARFWGKVEAICAGQFSGIYPAPGYRLLRKIAYAINAPVSGSTWKLSFSTPWQDQLKTAPRLTVGPDGAWWYRGVFVGERIRCGSPLEFYGQAGTSVTLPKGSSPVGPVVGVSPSLRF